MTIIPPPRPRRASGARSSAPTRSDHDLSRRRHPQGQGRVRVRVRHAHRGHAPRRHAAQPASACGHLGHRHRAGAGHPRGARRAHPRRRAGAQDLRPGDPRPAGAGHRPRALPGRAGGDRRRRPPRDRAPRGRRDRGRLRGARAADRRRGGHGAGRAGAASRHAADAASHAPATSCAICASTTAIPTRRPTSWSSGEYEVGMQDQAFLGPESGLAVPDGDGGVDLYIATQWLHVDQDQVAESLGLAPEKVRLTLGGVGGAFGGREDLSMQIHACMLALHTRRPVKMVYNREESFYGHVHRHPCTMRYEHGASRDGRLVFVRARIVLDGGAYASSSTAVCANAASLRLRALRGARRAHRRATSSTPTTRRAGRCAASARCRPASPTRRRWTGWPRRSDMDPVELRILNAMAPRQPHAHRPARRRARRRSRSCSSASRAMPLPPGEADWPAGRRRERDARRGRAPRRRLRRRDQEHRLLRGLRRLLDRARAAVDGGRRAARRGPHGGGRGRAGDRHRAGADRAHRAGRRARGGASTPTRRSARRARRRPRARPTSPAARSRPRARRCASGLGGAGGAAWSDSGSARRRRSRTGDGHRGDDRVAPSPDPPPRRGRPGRRARAVRVLRAPRRGRRRHRAGARARGRARPPRRRWARP